MNTSYFVSTNGELNPLMMILVIVDLILKGVTLYKSAKRDQKVWFVALLVINSLGILPLIYLVVNKDIFQRQVMKAVTKTKKSKK